ncbi:MAG: hypothetical protein ACJ74W_01620 [Pyrinomonadaceae bacterium]
MCGLEAHGAAGRRAAQSEAVGPGAQVRAPAPTASRMITLAQPLQNAM